MADICWPTSPRIRSRPVLEVFVSKLLALQPLRCLKPSPLRLQQQDEGVKNLEKSRKVWEMQWNCVKVTEGEVHWQLTSTFANESFREFLIKWKNFSGTNTWTNAITGQEIRRWHEDSKCAALCWEASPCLLCNYFPRFVGISWDFMGFPCLLPLSFHIFPHWHMSSHVCPVPGGH